jgi:cobalt/nickel transport system permease protein
MSGGHTHRLVIQGDSPVHRLAAHCKIAALLAFVVAVVLTPREAVWSFGGYALILAGLYAVGRIPPGFVARRLVIEVPFLLFAALLPVFGSGERVEVVGLSLSVEGLWAAWNILAKATLSVGATIVLIATTPVSEIIHGLERLRLPRALVAIMTFMIRYVDVLLDEVRRMRLALLSRGYSPRWIWQARAIAGSAGALFIRSFERGERVYLAMLSRGYDGAMPALRHGATSPAAWAWSMAVPALAAGLAVGGAVAT